MAHDKTDVVARGDFINVIASREQRRNAQCQPAAFYCEDVHPVFPEVKRPAADGPRLNGGMDSPACLREIRALVFIGVRTKSSSTREISREYNNLCR